MKPLLTGKITKGCVLLTVMTMLCLPAVAEETIKFEHKVCKKVGVFLDGGTYCIELEQPLTPTTSQEEYPQVGQASKAMTNIKCCVGVVDEYETCFECVSHPKRSFYLQKCEEYLEKAEHTFSNCFMGDCGITAEQEAWLKANTYCLRAQMEER